MDIEYKSKKLEKICTSFCEAKKIHGQDMAEKIQMRVDQISAATNIDMMLQFKIGRCHELTGTLKGHYAVDLVQPFRLVFTVRRGKIQIAKIIEITDYH